MQRKVEELDRANDNLRNLFEGTEIATVVLDRDLIIRSFTPAIRAIFNLIDIDRGRALTDMVSEVAGLDLRNEVEPVLATGRSRERRVVCVDGKVHYLMRILPYRTAGKSIDGVLITFTDISRIIEVEEYQKELTHRIETMLKMMHDAAGRSLGPGADRDTLLGSVQAIGDAYALVSRARWGEVELHDLAAQELGNYGIDGDGRAALDGPAVTLKANAAVHIGLALHELTNNAAKHGALSVPQGRVELSWAIEETGTPRSRLVIRWRELDGPQIGPPKTRPYGAALIETELPKAIGAETTLSVTADGLACDIVLPLSTGHVVPSVTRAADG